MIGERVRAAVKSIELDLLGLRLPNADFAIRSSDWRPDDASAYCARCGRGVGEGESTSTGCGRCRLTHVPWREVVRLGPYAGDLAKWIRLVKYRGWTEMGNRLGRRLGSAVAQCCSIDLDQTIVVPMPMPTVRRWARGIDHTTVLADGLSALLGLPMCSPLGKRDGPVQLTRTISERRQLGGRGIYPRMWKTREVTGWNVLLVDDVLTTGATFRRAVAAISKMKPLAVHVAVAAVSDR